MELFFSVLTNLIVIPIILLMLVLLMALFAFVGACIGLVIAYIGGTFIKRMHDL